MKKNIIIGVLFLAFVFMSYNYLNARYQVAVVQDQIGESAIILKCGIRCYSNKPRFHLVTDDNLVISFIHDEQGLSYFTLGDFLSGISIGFFFDGGKLASFMYCDGAYTIMTNIHHGLRDSGKMLERVERIGGEERHFIWFDDGSIEINTIEGY